MSETADPGVITTRWRCRMVNAGIKKSEVVLTSIGGVAHGELRLHIHDDGLRDLIEPGNEYELDIYPASD